MSQPTSSAATFYGAFTAILVIIAALVFVDLTLARIDRNEREQEAERYYVSGQGFAAAGNYDRAIDSFRTSFSMNREDTRAQLAYADALYQAGRLAEAETTARDLLARDPTNADASLIMARILVNRAGSEETGAGSQEEGISFYHRAIFGRWSGNSAAQQLEARLELADTLAQGSANEELLAELLPLRDVATGDMDLTRRIAGLYIQAGAPERAAELYQVVLEENPQDAEAFAGLGEAEFAQANFRTAARTFQTALRFAPGDAAIERRLAVTNQVLALDPMGRSLSSLERYRRSLMLLELTADSLTACTGPNRDALTSSFLEKADENLSRTVRVNERNDAVDENLNLAEQIWALRRASCGETRPEEEPIALVLTRVTQ